MGKFAARECLKPQNSGCKWDFR